MKHYPSITSFNKLGISFFQNGKPFIAFDKLDGSNIRAEWSQKKGWYKFGTRNELIDKSHQVFGKVPELVHESFEDFGKVLAKANHNSAVCFFEFYGPNSFAGHHLMSEKQTLSLIDISPYNVGIVEPHIFLDLAKDFNHAKVLFEGVITEEFVNQVKNKTLQDMTFEGVVCKQIRKTSKHDQLFMFKIKSDAWLSKLKNHCGQDEQLFKLLM